jgi:hypothetical protein
LYLLRTLQCRCFCDSRQARSNGLPDREPSCRPTFEGVFDVDNSGIIICRPIVSACRSASSPSTSFRTWFFQIEIALPAAFLPLAYFNTTSLFTAILPLHPQVPKRTNSAIRRFFLGHSNILPYPESLNAGAKEETHYSAIYVVAQRCLHTNYQSETFCYSSCSCRYSLFYPTHRDRFVPLAFTLFFRDVICGKKVMTGWKREDEAMDEACDRAQESFEVDVKR